MCATQAGPFIIKIMGCVHRLVFAKSLQTQTQIQHRADGRAATALPSAVFFSTKNDPNGNFFLQKMNLFVAQLHLQNKILENFHKFFFASCVTDSARPFDY